MTSTIPTQEDQEVFYPYEDGEPLAESYDHLMAIFAILSVLTQYLAGTQATVLADQFLYYSKGFPKLRVAPDVMVIFDVAPGGRDNYKIWQEGQVPSVIFEITSPGTQSHDTGFKKTLYEQLGVQEYWLFDPRGQWIQKQLRGYRLISGEYQLITDFRSDPLQLKLQVEDKLLCFYREDTGEKLLIADELSLALTQEAEARISAEALAEQERLRAEQEHQRAEQEHQRAEKERQRADALAEKLKELGQDPETF